ncbi:dehydration-responsive element-binding protein 3-like [Carya illinoinensis]|uniref:dehydration-responsive element-binding protein 3-like n=1 Tax=Carya illinoinensis TaxID=32201 RepID=UPI001C723B94|nr:dehydration-responsive element-binding protein 3-like [Carya illinoinensis]
MEKSKPVRMPNDNESLASNQAEAAKATQMDTFNSPSSLLSLLVSPMDLSKESEELSEIVELPSLGASYELEYSGNEFVFVDSMDGWEVFSLPWLQSVEDGGYACDQMAVPKNGALNSFEAGLFVGI